MKGVYFKFLAGFSSKHLRYKFRMPSSNRGIQGKQLGLIFFKSMGSIIIAYTFRIHIFIEKEAYKQNFVILMTTSLV